MVEKYFGTDGIRGKVGEGFINPEFALKLGWAAGEFLRRKNPDLDNISVVIAKDTRLSGYLFEYAIASGLTAAGVNVYLLGPMPTPAVAYFTRTFDANLGMVISASHNSFEDNGIKFFCSNGLKLSDQDEINLSKIIKEDLVCADAVDIGKITRIDDAKGRYIEFCKSAVPALMSFSGIKIVLDCANGATYQIAPNVFRERGAEVIVIHDKPNGININKNCGSCYLKSLQEKVLEEKADLGIAFDGDGDRVMLVDHNGLEVNGDQILFLLAMDRLDRGVLAEGVVGTVMTNMAIENALSDKGISLLRSKVGDRYVMEMLNNKKWNLGGESSGHIISLSQTTTGDGIIAAMQVLAYLIRCNIKLSDALSDAVLFPQKMINISFSGFESLVKSQDFWDKVNKLVNQAESSLNKDGRVLVRASGTEPVIRVMVEARSMDIVEKYLDGLVGSIKKLIV